MSKTVAEMTNDELAVETELAGIHLFGFDTYKHENRARAAEHRARYDELTAAAIARGMYDGGQLKPEYQKVIDASPAVAALAARNEAFIKRSV